MNGPENYREVERLPADAQDRWLTVAERFQVPPKTVHTWRYTRTGPLGVKIGRHVRFRESEVRRWEREREAAARIAQGGDTGE